MSAPRASARWPQRRRARRGHAGPLFEDARFLAHGRARAWRAALALALGGPLACMSVGCAAAPSLDTHEAPDAPSCAPLAELGPLVSSGEPFFGYLALGEPLGPASCAGPGSPGGPALSLGLRPEQAGPLILSTRHPSTTTAASIEVRQRSRPDAACAGALVACAEADELTLEVAPDDDLLVLLRAATSHAAPTGERGESGEAVIALSARLPGVCDGLGERVEAEGLLLPGGTFHVDTSASTASLRGSCGTGQAPPEALVRFVAPRSGAMLATTLHPDTQFDSLLHVRRAQVDGHDLCGSSEAELACMRSGAEPRGGFLRFGVEEGLLYDLLVDGDDMGPIVERPFGSMKGLATVILGYAVESPVTDALTGCDHLGVRDRYLVFAAAGEALHVEVDTVDAETAADMRLALLAPDGEVLHEADDEVPCTFSPPAYACPAHGLTAPQTGLFALEIYVGASEQCADPSIARYRLEVTVDDEPAPLVLERDQ